MALLSYSQQWNSEGFLLTFDDFTIQFIESKVIEIGDIKIKLSQPHVEVVSVLGCAWSSLQLKTGIEVLVIEDVGLASFGVVHVVSIRVPVHWEEGKTRQICMGPRPEG